LPAVPGLAIAAVLAAWQVPQLWAAASTRMQVGLIVLVIFSVAATWRVPAPTDFARQWSLLGAQYEYVSQLDKARLAYRRVLELKPDDQAARESLQRLGPLEDPAAKLP
jgi:hypothetical protein